MYACSRAALNSVEGLYSPGPGVEDGLIPVGPGRLSSGGIKPSAPGAMDRLDSPQLVGGLMIRCSRRSGDGDRQTFVSSCCV